MEGIDIRKLSKTFDKVKNLKMTVAANNVNDQISNAFVDNITKEEPITDLAGFVSLFPIILETKMKETPPWLVRRIVDLMPMIDIHYMGNLAHSSNSNSIFNQKPFIVSSKINRRIRSAYKSRLFSLIKNASNMPLKDFMKLLNFFLWTSCYYDDKELEFGTEFVKLAIEKISQSKSTQAINVLAIVLNRRRPDFHYPELVELLVDTVFQGYGGWHTNFLCDVVGALFHTGSKINQEKQNQLLSLTATSFQRDFDAISGTHYTSSAERKGRGEERKGRG